MKEKTRIVFYTKWSKGIEQSNFLTVIKEYYVGKEITFAEILFEI